MFFFAEKGKTVISFAPVTCVMSGVFESALC